MASAFPIESRLQPAVVFKDGGNVATAKEFVRFLVAEGWLMHYLDFSGERSAADAALLDSPFWLDPSDPHRMAAAMQVSRAPAGYDYAARLRRLAARPDLTRARLGEGDPPGRDRGHQPEQAVDEAIARIKQILAE